MKNSSLLLTAIAMMLAVTVSANAQGGCVNSPENPTVVLALVGGAGALFSAVRARVRHGRR